MRLLLVCVVVCVCCVLWCVYCVVSVLHCGWCVCCDVLHALWCVCFVVYVILCVLCMWCIVCVVCLMVCVTFVCCVLCILWYVCVCSDEQLCWEGNHLYLVSFGICCCFSQSLSFHVCSLGKPVLSSNRWLFIIYFPLILPHDVRKHLRSILA